MRKPAQGRPVNVSTALFMDLAFLMIAALVLLVNEPVERAVRHQQERAEAAREARQRKFAQLEFRSSIVRQIVEADIPGESLYLNVDSEGAVREIRAGGGRSEPLALDKLPKTVGQMADGERVVVLVTSPDVPYGKAAAVREGLEALQQKGKLSRILEMVDTGAKD